MLAPRNLPRHNKGGIMHININEQTLLDSAHRVKDFLKKKGITRNGKPIGMAFCRAMLTEGLLSRTYEELSNTGQLTSDVPDTKTKASAPQVCLLWYGAEAVLAKVVSCGDEKKPVFSLKYVRCQGAGTDLEVSINELHRQGEVLAKEMGTTLGEYTLPEVLGDEWEYDDVLEFASDLGYGQPQLNLLETLDSDDLMLTINGIPSPYRIDGDWFQTVVDAAQEAAEDAFESDGTLPESSESYAARLRGAMHHVIWHAEGRNERNLYEHFITLGMITKATSPDDGKTWLLPLDESGEGSLVLKIFR